MKKLKITALLAVMAFSPFYANVFPVEGTSLVKAIAEALKWKSESIDVGNIPQGKPKLIRFEFTNTSKKANHHSKRSSILRMYNCRLFKRSNQTRQKRICRS